MKTPMAFRLFSVVDRACTSQFCAPDSGYDSTVKPFVSTITGPSQALLQALELQLLHAGHAYAAAISACAVGSVWTRAVELFDEMMEVNIKPDVVSCTALISALGSDAQWERAERVIVWMHQASRPIPVSSTRRK